MLARKFVIVAILATSALLLGCTQHAGAPATPSPASGSGLEPRTEEPTLWEEQPASPAARSHEFDALKGALSPRFQSYVDDFMVAELALSRASEACSDACRALRSMVRAADRMCAIATSEQELDRCETARDRVRGAREHVRRACNVCTQGPPLEEE